MRPSKPPGGKCPSGEVRESCPLTCKYNFFESEEFTIDAWELKCLDCGWRETIGFRSDDEDADPDVDPKVCPFCHIGDLSPGQNPCESCRD